MSEQKEISWMALETGMPVASSEGTEVGQITDVVADTQKDIFSGVAFRSGVLGTRRFVPAVAIAEITEDGITLKVSTEETEALEEYED